MNRYGTVNGGGENCAYGRSNGIEIVMGLFVDDGVSSRGHRSNLVNGNFKFAGSFTGPHKDYG